MDTTALHIKIPKLHKKTVAKLVLLLLWSVFFFLASWLFLNTVTGINKTETCDTGISQHYSCSLFFFERGWVTMYKHVLPPLGHSNSTETICILALVDEAVGFPVAFLYRNGLSGCTWQYDLNIVGTLIDALVFFGIATVILRYNLNRSTMRNLNNRGILFP